MKKIILSMVVVILLFGCATRPTILTRSVVQDMEEISNEDFVDTVSYVLTDNGFGIKFLNNKFGIVTTEWRRIKVNLDTTANVLNAVSSVFSEDSDYVHRTSKMMIEVKILDNGYQVVPKIAKLREKDYSSADFENAKVIYPKADTKQGQLVIKIVQEINNLLNISDSFNWREKQITL